MAKRAKPSGTARAGGKTTSRQRTPSARAAGTDREAPARKAAKAKGPSRRTATVTAALARTANGGRARSAANGKATNGKNASHVSADGIALTLTSAQVRQILHAAGGEEAELRSVLEGSVITADGPLALKTWEGRYREELDAGSASSSLLRGMLTLACFPRDGTRRTVHWVAEHTGMEMSTTHRYIRTLLLLGFLDQDPKTRAYGRVTA